jgi:E1A/CREB-binding protein
VIDDEEEEEITVATQLSDPSIQRKRSLHRSRVEFISVTEAENAKEQATRAKHKKRKAESSSKSNSGGSTTIVDGAMELSEDITMKWDSKLHHLRCIEVTNSKVPPPIVDLDEPMDSPILNTRLALLGVCQGNRYQFDQRRRAKHSTMMLLYHLHNPTVPLYLYTCNECQSDILSGFRWHCPICPDFDLCHECKRGVVHQHQLECHKVKVSADTDNQAQQRSLNLFLESLVHNTTCNLKTCEKPECRKITELLRHRANCRVRASGGCDTCHRILCLLQMHARRCETKDCKVLYCADLKRRIKENQKRKPAAEIIVHTGTDNQAKPKIAVT